MDQQYLWENQIQTISVEDEYFQLTNREFELLYNSGAGFTWKDRHDFQKHLDGGGLIDCDQIACCLRSAVPFPIMLPFELALVFVRGQIADEVAKGCVRQLHAKGYQVGEFIDFPIEAAESEVGQ